MLKKGFLAVDIGSSNIKLVNGRVNKDIIEIREYDIIPTPRGSFDDGKVIDVKSIAHALKNSISKNRMKAGRVIFTITGTGVITRDIQLPKSTLEEIEKMLEYEAQQYFPVSLENYVLDFKVIDEVIKSEGVFNTVFLAAVPVNQVNEYMKIPPVLKMSTAVVDLPSNCISKLFFGMEGKYKGMNTEESTPFPKEFAVVDIGSKTTGVCIFEKGKLMFNRILLSGSSDIDIAISQTCGINYNEVGEVKHSIENAFDDVKTSSEGELTDTGKIIRRAADNILEDINRFFEFYKSRSTGNKLSKIYLCGGGSKLKGLDEYIGSYFSIPAQRLEICAGLIYKGIKGENRFMDDFIFITNAVGALVR